MRNLVAIRSLMAVAAYCGLFATGDSQLIGTELRANRLVFDSLRNNLYATVPGSVPKIGNTLLIVNPQTLIRGDSLFVGSEPWRVELSASRSTAFTMLAGSNQITQVDLAGWSLVRTFGVGATGLDDLTDIAIQPGTESVVAVSDGNSVAIFEDGIARPVISPADGALLEFSDDPARLYGFNNLSTAYSYYRLAVDQNGVTTIDQLRGMVRDFFDEMVYAGSKLYLSLGTVIDPEPRQILGSFPVSGPMIPDVAANRALFVTRTGGVTSISAFDMDTYALIESRRLPEVQGNTLSFVRWGDSGLAFCTDAGWTYSYRSSVVWDPRISYCEAANIIRGNLVSGDINSLHLNDNSRMIIRPGISLSSQSPPILLELVSHAPNGNPESLGFAIESGASSTNVRQTLYLYNYTTSQYELVDTRNTTAVDDRVTVDRIGNGHDYIAPGTGEVRARLTYQQVGPILQFPWHVRIDVARWLFPAK